MMIVKSAFFCLIAALSKETCAAALPTELAVRAALPRISPPTGCLVVRGTGTQMGEYITVNAAVAAISTSTVNRCIFIYSGIYNETVYKENKGPLNIYGYTSEYVERILQLRLEETNKVNFYSSTTSYKPNTVTITKRLGSYDAGSLDASSALNVVSNDINIYNLNVENTYGVAGQVSFQPSASKY